MELYNAMCTQNTWRYLIIDITQEIYREMMLCTYSEYSKYSMLVDFFTATSVSVIWSLRSPCSDTVPCKTLTKLVIVSKQSHLWGL